MGLDVYMEGLSPFSDDAKEPILENKARFDELVKLRDNAESETDKETYQKAVQRCSTLMWEASPGYFRDSYNRTSVYSAFKLPDFGPYLNNDGDMPPEKAKEYLDVLLENEPLRKDDWKARQSIGEGFRDYGPDESLDEWYVYFLMKRENLLKFLFLQIILGVKTSWSY